MIITIFILASNLIGIGVSVLLLTIAFPKPSIFSDAPLWVTFAAIPAYIAIALALGTFIITRRLLSALRWSIEERKPTPADERATFQAPLWVGLGVLALWGIGTALNTTLYGLADSTFIPVVGFSVSFVGILVAAFSYLFTEFALRPVAAQALEAGHAPTQLDTQAVVTFGLKAIRSTRLTRDSAVLSAFDRKPAISLETICCASPAPRPACTIAVASTLICSPGERPASTSRSK